MVDRFDKFVSEMNFGEASSNNRTMGLLLTHATRAVPQCHVRNLQCAEPVSNSGSPPLRLC